MPGKGVTAGALGVGWEAGEFLAVVGVIAAAVPPFLTELLAHAHLVVGGDAYIAGIEEGVEFFGQNDSVLDMVTPRAEVGLDMSGVEDRNSVLASDGALVLVGAEEPQAEGTLTFAHDDVTNGESPLIHIERNEALGQVGRYVDLVRGNGRVQARFPTRVAFGFALDDVRRPALLLTPGNPAFGGPIDGVTKDETADWFGPDGG